MKKLKEIHDETINESQPDQRFAVTMEFYIWAKNAADAKRQAQAIAAARQQQFDDQAEITDIHPMPFGTMQ